MGTSEPHPRFLIVYMMSNKGFLNHYKIIGVHLQKCIIMNQLHIHDSYNLF
jgi:hypothetical protein